MYVKWLIMAIASFVISLVCYITNPIVVLFADKDGELPTFLNYWQTWDDSCNPNDVYDYKQLPTLFLFDYYKHYEVYEGTTPELARVGQSRWFSRCIDDNFTLKERLQRYVYRVYWLTRNCSYGFGFWWFGKNVNPANVIWYKADDEVKFGKEMLTDTFTYGDSREVCTIFGYRIERNWYIGWKIPINEQGIRRVMIAIRFPMVKIKKVGDEM